MKKSIYLAIWLSVCFGNFFGEGRWYAQSTCDNPPLDVARLEGVWEKTDFCLFQEGIFDEIISGGVGRDGIPPIDDPIFEDIATASQWLQPQSPVIVVQIQDEVRAYPLGILIRHEIVNDVMGDTPIAVTFCPLCNSAIVFDRRVDGQVLRFGVSGLLRNSDLIMWDDITQSWWQQLTGIGIVGTYTDRLLDILPSHVVSFGVFQTQFPTGKVLSSNGRAYGYNPYALYDSDPMPFLFRGTLDNRLVATERVLAFWSETESVAYPFTVLAQEQVINDTINGVDVVAFWQSGAVSALDQAVIDESRDVGMAALYQRQIEGKTLSFRRGDDGLIYDNETNSIWNIFGMAIDGELVGTQLQQELAFPHFWFAWVAFRPETRLYGVE